MPCEFTGDLSPEELRAHAYATCPHGFSPAVIAYEQGLVLQHRARIAASRAGVPH